MEEKGLRLPSFNKIPGAVAIDLDGTLLNRQTQLSKRNLAAIEACVARGIPVVIATSRPARTTRRALGYSLADKCSLVIMNGALALGVPPLSGVFREPLPPDVARGTINLLMDLEPEVRLTIELDGWEFGRNWHSSPEELWQYNAATPDMVMTLEEALERNPAKIAASRMGKDVSDLADAVLQRFGGTASVLSANDMTFLNIVSARTSKSEALRILLQSCDILLEDVLAFGDDVPDLDLLEACGIPVAMANCVPEVRAVTSYTTASNDEDGVAIVLEKMLATGW
ncbi:MAG TPA: HAD hydrolase family protein [Dehalococcoidia bacterium]|nr:HAD hydrolase family protein [Dehalococcoidia bacterium]